MGNPEIIGTNAPQENGTETPAVDGSLEGLVNARNETEAEQSSKEFVAAYKAADSKEQQKMVTQIDKKLEKQDQHGAAWNRLHGLKKSIGEFSAAVQKQGEKVIDQGAKALSGSTDAVKKEAQELSEKPAVKTAINTTLVGVPFAATAFGVVWLTQVWRNALKKQEESKDGKKISAVKGFFQKMGKILFAVGCTVITIPDVIALLWAKNAVSSSPPSSHAS